MIDKDQPDSEIIDGIIEEQIKNNPQDLSFILSILPTLRNVSQEKIREVLRCSIKNLLENRSSFKKHDNNNHLNRIFDQLQKLYLENQVFRGLIKNEIIYLESDASLSNVIYSFYLELFMFHPFRKDSEPLKFDLSNKDAFIKQTLLDPFLFRLDKYMDDHNFQESYLDYTLEFISLFPDKLFSDALAIFGTFGFGPFIELFLYHQTLDINIQKMPVNLGKLEQAGLDKMVFVNFITNPNNSFYLDKNHALVIAKYFGEAKDNFVSLILVSLIIKGLDRFMREDNSYTMSDLKAVSGIRGNLLDQINAKNEIRERMSLAIDLFPVNNLPFETEKS